MVNKVFRAIGIIMIRISGIIFGLISFGILYYSMYICKNICDILSVANQINISGWRLLVLFLANLIALIFDWTFAALILIIAIGMILYKTKAINDLLDNTITE